MTVIPLFLYQSKNLTAGLESPELKKESANSVVNPILKKYIPISSEEQWQSEFQQQPFEATGSKGGWSCAD